MSYDNTGKLLRIQTSLLAALQNEKSKLTPGSLAYEQKKAQIEDSLTKYKELVTEVDRGIYHELQDKIRSISKGNYKYEDELDHLDDLEKFYNQFVSIQEGFKDTISLYSSDKINLSPIDDLNVSYYLKRKDIINSYLGNKKKITEFKRKLEEYNDELYESEQAKAKLDKIIVSLDDELKSKFFSSEGRLLLPNNSLKYTSIINELEKNGITVKDEQIDEEVVDTISKEAKEAKDKLEAAKISYEVRPDPSQKDIIDEIEKDYMVTSYKLSLIRLVKQIFKPSENYEDALTKRQGILELLDHRKKCLDKANIKFALDPFSRLNINDQISKIEIYKNTGKDVEKLRKIISQYNVEIDELETCNERYILELNNHLDEPVLEEEEEEPIPEEKPAFTSYKSKEEENESIELVETSKLVPDNQVVRVKASKINFNRSKEKSQKVALKVIELLNRDKKAKDEMNPELVIEQKQDDLFTEETPFVNDIEPDNLFDEEDPFLDDNKQEDDIFANEDPFLDDNKEEVTEDDMFNDVEPFEEPKLFTEKDDTVDEMPDMSMLLDLEDLANKEE